MGLRVPATMDDELELELELLVHEVTANLDPVHTNLGKYGKSINISPFSPSVHNKTAYSDTENDAFQKRCPRRIDLKTPGSRCCVDRGQGFSDTMKFGCHGTMGSLVNTT